jgi:hypothetical protein
VTDKDAAQMIQRCIEEIQGLQNQVAVLSPKAAAYETVTQILGLLPRPQQGYGEDMIWRLRNELAKLQPKPEVATAEA